MAVVIIVTAVYYITFPAALVINVVPVSTSSAVALDFCTVVQGNIF